MMKIAVIGAGAMGMLFGGRLAMAGNEVTMVDVVPDVLDAIRKNGIIMEDAAGIHSIPVGAKRAEDISEKMELVLLFTKTLYSRPALESAIKTFLGDQTYVLTLQNGLGNIEVINEYVAEDKIFVGVTNYASDVKGPGKIAATGNGYVRLMSANLKDSSMLQMTERTLKEAGFDATVTEQVFEAIWEKAGFNAAINSTTAICHVPVGGVGSVAEGRSLAFQIARETALVAQAHGVMVTVDKIIHSLEKAFAEHKEHYTSMAQDVQKKRKTEVAYINGGIVKKAREKELEVPFTEAVYDLLRVVEETYDIQEF